MARVIPRDQLAAYQRWQANDFRNPTERRPDRQVDQAIAAPLPETPPPEFEVVDMPVSLPTAEDIERINEQARAEGYQRGYEEGMALAQEEMKVARATELAKISALTASFANALKEIDQLVAEQTLELALEVARQIVRGSLQTRQDLLLPLIREALQSLPLHHGTINVHTNPEDVQTLREGAGELGHPNLHFVPDASILAGGCLIKAGHSDIDATVESRWKRVLEAIGANPQAWMNN